MTAQLLTSELGNLIQESKRKHADLRNAAEKSLEELKTLRLSSEAQVAADLSLRLQFVNPFLIACGTKNVKYTSIAIVCLQRLAVSRALPKSRLGEILEAFRGASPAGLDVQLKILQALPSLLQNYANDLTGDLIATALSICTILQGSKNGIVTNTAAATLQQLVLTIFEKVVTEDKISKEAPIAGEAPSENGPIPLRAAALDACRLFNDLCLMTESQRPLFLRSASIPKTFGLELIESVLTNHSQVFLTHQEQASILRSRVMPFIISSLSEKLNFAVTVRITRILYSLLRFNLSILSTEGEMALGLLTYMLDHDTALWKRSLCMEVLRGLFSDAALIRQIFAMYDAQEGRKPILRDLVAALVRISSEKPSIIGLGLQSSIPFANHGNSSDTDQAMLEASGVPGIIGSAVSSSDPGVGISTQWSTMRLPCIEQLDKTDPPLVPVTYIYSLTLACINGFSEGLAKFILPLTASERSSSKLKLPESKLKEFDPNLSPKDTKVELEKPTFTKKNTIWVNPLTLTSHHLFHEIKICAGIVDQCWPAILASCSTFLYSALDAEYYHSLVRSFQKFTHVAGLLHLSTPRDAFLTTLGKAAVPPNLLVSNLPVTSLPAIQHVEKQGILSNAKGLLSGESLIQEKGRQPSIEPTSASLNTRNLLCLRALLNLGIALGPTLSSGWEIILGTLQNADLVMLSNSIPGSTVAIHKTENQSINENAITLSANLGSEIKAVETAAARLIESTTDYPNNAFLEVIIALSSLLKDETYIIQSEDQKPQVASQIKAQTHSRNRNTSVVISPIIHSQKDLFALKKIGDVASININRLISHPADIGGWDVITSELILASCSSTAPASVRLAAAEILTSLILEAATTAIPLSITENSVIQLRLLDTLRNSLQSLSSVEREMSVAVHSTDVNVHKIILEGLKSILEQCGECLLNGWDIVFAIIGSVFVTDSLKVGSTTIESNVTKTHSAKLTRSSFNSLELICSDFLSSFPNRCFIILVDTLYNFCTQNDDLNISLTTVTFFWVLSDFISGRTNFFSWSADLVCGSEVPDFIKMAGGEDLAVSDAALWMLLLLRLAAVTTDDRLELRNSAIQTLLRIFDAYGDRLSSNAWAICLESVIFNLLFSIEERLKSTTEDSENFVSDKDKTGWHGTTVVILTGLTNLFADYIDVLSIHSSFGKSWQTLLQHFNRLLEFQILDINTAVFNALRQILSKGNLHESCATNFDASAVNQAWVLWSKSLPISSLKTDKKNTDNQQCLVAYVSALEEIYRLIQFRLDTSKVKTMLALLQQAVRHANITTYSADIDHLTPLQSKVLDLFKMMRSDVKGVPSLLIRQVAEIVELAFEPSNMTGSKHGQPTFVALSKSSMDILERLIVTHSSDQEIYTSGAISESLEAFKTPIVLKYSFPIITKSLPPWQQATTSVLSSLKSIIPFINNSNLNDEIVQVVWSSIVEIGNGIIKADCTGFEEDTRIKIDEKYDIECFLALRKLMTPALGSLIISDETRRAYTECLFQMSLVHTPLLYELPYSHQEILAILSQPQKGQTVDITPSCRSKMSYVCFDELVSLTRIHDGSEARIKLAQAAAPYLILRTGLTLRSFIADQPLRGLMPQPLTQRNELIYILRALVCLRCEPRAIPYSTGVDRGERKHLDKLYILFVKAVQVAVQDQELLQCLTQALEVIGNDSEP
ncbi:Bgt-310 [Blumeria graminis f. sp. tritici]|uniref:Bgt-310 n=2 Tax=Blumeria graminis f. sp. tritici TaxID=62690 RepID=A0A061HCD3_BLUGR|nr:Peripheral membrane protein [Blumeria graminis f. sp. tritici 96224]VDB95016.1 Bgt-310 [Blumeria graminis f. sp. tritici]